jgi:hypothetical protein
LIENNEEQSDRNVFACTGVLNLFFVQKIDLNKIQNRELNQARRTRKTPANHEVGIVEIRSTVSPHDGINDLDR